METATVSDEAPSQSPEDDHRPLLGGREVDRPSLTIPHADGDEVRPIQTLDASTVPADDEGPVARKSKLKADRPVPPVQTAACGCPKSGRNLVVCIDGTSNEFGKKNTNVIELYSLIRKEDQDKQRTYYNSGVGTYAGPSQRPVWKVAGQTLDLAIAWNFESTVLDAYRWLSETYKVGDRIYLFGFSRGAYQVRVLSAMIDKVGLIHRGNEKQIPFAYKWYINPDDDSDLDAVEPTPQPSQSAVTSPSTPRAPSHPNSVSFGRRFVDTVKRGFKMYNRSDSNNAGGDSLDRPDDSMPVTASESHPTESSDTKSKIHTAKRFKQVFSRDVKVHFVGAWDTVSSVGIARGPQLLPRTIDGMKHVCHFRHALALDERRVKFLPEYAYGGVGPLQVRVPNKKQFNETKEVWFAGTHSDVGGGNDYNQSLDRTRPSLRWMFLEASVAGLRLQPFQRPRDDAKVVSVTASLTRAWWPLEWLPLRRMTYTTQKDGKHTTLQPHAGAARVIQEGQKIHPSVWLATDLGTQYTPRATVVPPNDAFWSQLKEDVRTRPDGTFYDRWKEVDLYDLLESLVKQYTSGMSTSTQEGDWQQRTQLAMLKLHADSGVEGRRALVHEVVLQLVQDGALEAKNLSDVLDLLLNSADAKIDDAINMSYLELRSRLFHHLQLKGGEDNGRRRLAQRFLNGFTDNADRTIQILKGHTRSVYTAIFLPADQYRVLSGSASDSTLRSWDVQGDTEPLVIPFDGVRSWNNSVAFSSDGQRVVAQSEEYALQVLDAATGNLIRRIPTEHTNFIASVAFSSDGTRVVSSSHDETLWVWDVQKGESVCGPLEGHSGSVYSAAFSPNGQRVVSGSSDNSVRIWDAQTGEPLRKPLEGHTDEVNCVIYSPDGKQVASGSDDWTIRIWDAETGDAIGEPLEGHDGQVLSIAFSLDGSRLVTGSSDQTVRVWDVGTRHSVGKPLMGHSDGVLSVAFSSDGKRIISASGDGTIRIWDVL